MRKALFTCGAALLAAMPVTSQALTLEDLLVEKGVISRGEAAGAATSAGRVSWNGATNIEFPDTEGFTLNIKSLLQTRYGFYDQPDGAENISSFDVRRARIAFYGDVKGGEFSYYMQSDLVGIEDRIDADPLFSSNEARTPTLQTAYVTWRPSDGIELRMGQAKTLLSRQFNTTDGYEQLPERSIASDFLALGRQQGLTGITQFFDGRLTAVAGIYNGRSANSVVTEDNGTFTDSSFVEEQENVGGIDTKHSGLIALRYDPIGDMNAYQEGDIDFTQDLALSFGASYTNTEGGRNISVRNAVSVPSSIDTDFNSQVFSVDANLKYQGFSVHAEYFVGSDDFDRSQPGDAQLFTDVDPTGFYVQAGYFLVPKELEIVARYSMADCDLSGSGSSLDAPINCPFSSGLGSSGVIDDIDEVAVGLNYYFSGHNVRAQLAYDQTQYNLIGGDEAKQNSFILQFQIMG